MKKAEPMVYEFWRRYWRKTILLVVAMQLLAVIIIAAALHVTGVVYPIEIFFWITLFAVLVGIIAINVLVTFIITEPLKQLVAAVAQTAGERSPLTPPNPNAKRYEKNGFKPILQTIYEAPLKLTPIETPAAATDKPAFNVLDGLDTSNAGVAFFDENGNLLYANHIVPIMEDADKKQRLMLEFYTDMDFDTWLHECRERAVHADKVWARIASKPLGQPDRKIFDISASYEKGSAVPVSLVFIDRTEEYAAEDEDLNFISFAAHELRGPITVIRGYLDSLNDELASVTTAEQQELFKRLIVSANRLDTYIKNILNSSKYDRRHFNVRLSETTLHTIYDLVADDMALRASAQHRLLSVDLPTTLPTIAADASSVSEVFANLIDNAIKYSNEGGAITVRAERDGDFLEVEVEDQGIGMPANVVGNLFHKFYRSHRSRETVAGTGIGLYISKAIVESHGGTMNARSVEGEGSVFSFTLPIYSTVADKLTDTDGDNQNLIIRSREGSWIKNHGKIRG